MTGEVAPRSLDGLYKTVAAKRVQCDGNTTFRGRGDARAATNESAPREGE